MRLPSLLARISAIGDKRRGEARAELPAGDGAQRRRGRREVLGLGTAAGVGAVAVALLPRGMAEAGHGPDDGVNALHLGKTNDATTVGPTKIESRAATGEGRGAFSVFADDPEFGAPVDSAIYAFSPNARGVRGESVNRQGVLGISTNFAGVGALSLTTYGVIGNGKIKAGVLGYVPTERSRPRRAAPVCTGLARA